MRCYPFIRLLHTTYRIINNFEYNPGNEVDCRNDVDCGNYVDCGNDVDCGNNVDCIRVFDESYISQEIIK